MATATATRGRWYEFGVPVTRQLALYQTFHRGAWNRRLHYITMPFILGSGFAIAACLTPLLGIVFYTAAALSFLTLDVLATLLLAAWVLPLVLTGNLLAHRLGVMPVTACAVVVQLACWYLSVGIGHERCEPRLEVGHRHVSSNVYLERHMFRLQNVGPRPSPMAAWLQLLIAPFHMTLQGLFRLGYRPRLRHEVERLVAENLRRLAREQPILDDGAWSARSPTNGD